MAWTDLYFHGDCLRNLLVYYACGIPILIVVFRSSSSPFKAAAFDAATHVLAIPIHVSMVYVSAAIWFAADGVSTFPSRLHGAHSPVCTWLITFTLVYLSIEFVLKAMLQIWDRRLVPKSQETIQYLHHICTILLCIHCLSYDFLHYYAMFYIGIAEGSSIPLGFMNLFKMSPDLAAKYPTLNITVSLCFCFSFLIIRVVWWLKVNMMYWTDIAPLANSANESARSGVPLVHIYLWLFAHFFLTAMQLYWASKVVKGIIRTAKRKPRVD